jgi:hypothetical protein
MLGSTCHIISFTISALYLLQVINDIRNRTGARVNLFDEEKNCGDRLLQIMSTEDVQDQHCAGFDAAMDCVQVGLVACFDCARSS